MSGLLLATQLASAGTLQPGGYIQDDFLKVLSATRSPTASMGDFMHGPQSIELVPASDGLRFGANWNWHEGSRLLTLHQDGRIDPGEDATRPTLTLLPPHRFRLSALTPGGKAHIYINVGDVDRLVVRLALVGHYADRQGHHYVFGEDGILRGLGADTPFALYNDHVLGPRFDYFTLGNDKARVIAFRHRGSLLILYPASRSDNSPSGIGDADFAHPMVVLHRIGPLQE
jgi:hypothetical protein